mgnify:CR=1 FL=1
MNEENVNSKVSVSPITETIYELPREINDKQGIDEFLSHHKGKPVVVVQGLGFVGGVMSLVCANATLK